MNSFDQNQDSQDNIDQLNSSNIQEMNISNINNDNTENDQNNSESRPFTFQQLKSRSENSSVRNISRNSNEGTKTRHSANHLTGTNNLFRDNLIQQSENDYSSSEHLDQYPDENSFGDLKSFYNDIFEHLNTFVQSITDQEIDQNSDFNETIFSTGNTITEFLERANLLKEERFIELKIANVTCKIDRIKNKDKQVKEMKEEIQTINEKLISLREQKIKLTEETDSIRSENQNLYSIPFLSRPVIPTERRSPYLREVNRVRDLKNEIARQEKMLDYQKHEMDREVAILTNHVSLKESEVLNLHDQITKAESRNIVAYVPCSIFSKTRNFSNTNTNPSSSLSSSPNVYSIPNNKNQAKLAKPRKLAALSQKPKEKTKSKKKNNTTRYPRQKKTMHSVHEPSTLAPDTSPRSPRTLNKNRQKVTFFPNINENYDSFDDSDENKVIKNELEEISDSESAEAKEKVSNNSKLLHDPNTTENNFYVDSVEKDEPEQFPISKALNQKANEDKTEGFPSFNSNNSQPAEGFASFGDNNQSSTNSTPTEGFPSFKSNNSQSTEGFPSFDSNKSAPTEGFPSFNSNDSQPAGGFPSINSNNSQPAEGFPSFSANNSHPTEGFPSFGASGQSSANPAQAEGFPGLKSGFPSMSSNNQENSSDSTDKEGFPGMNLISNNNNSDSKVSFSFGSKENNEKGSSESKPGLHITFAKNVMERVEHKKKLAEQEKVQYLNIAKKFAEEVIMAAIKIQKEKDEDEFSIYNLPPEEESKENPAKEDEDEFSIYNQPKEEDEFSIYNQPPKENAEEDEFGIYNQPPEEDKNENENQQDDQVNDENRDDQNNNEVESQNDDQSNIENNVNNDE